MRRKQIEGYLPWEGGTAAEESSKAPGGAVFASPAEEIKQQEGTSVAYLHDKGEGEPRSPERRKWLELSKNGWTRTLERKEEA